MSKPESSEQQHSYFYVYWPEDRSSATAATAPATATNPLLGMNASAQSIGATAAVGSSSLAPTDPLLQPSSSTAPVYAGLVTHPAVIPGASNLPLVSGATATGNSPTATSRTAEGISGTEDFGSESSDAGSPVAVATLSTSLAGQTLTAADVAEAAQTVTITNSGEYNGSITMTPASIITSTAPAPHVLITPKTHAVYNPISSSGLIYVSDAATVLSRGSQLPGPDQRGNGCSIVGASTSAVLHPAQENPRRQKHPHPSFESPPLKNIGTWAEIALVNLRKILNTVFNQEDSSEEGGSARKRMCIRDMSAPSHPDCLECEIKSAEINVLRKRVAALQDQMTAIASSTSAGMSSTSVIHHKLSNGNIKSPLSPPPISPIQQQIENTLLQVDPMHPAAKELLHVRRRSRPSSEHTPLPEALAGIAPPEAQPPHQPPPQPQPGEAIELVSGSGVYILAYRLEEARREAKTGTQLARKLMDCFWDKDTLAKSTLTPRSKFQYQQLDPKIIKAIEVYCLNYDNSVHAKDIHATMTDKCCQARSRYRVLQ